MSNDVVTRDVRIAVVFTNAYRYIVTISYESSLKVEEFNSQARAEEFVHGFHQACRMLGKSTFTTFSNESAWVATFAIPAD